MKIMVLRERVWTALMTPRLRSGRSGRMDRASPQVYVSGWPRSWWEGSITLS
jgi:hypothetical protein